jgi:hypothetical protein
VIDPGTSVAVGDTLAPAEPPTAGDGLGGALGDGLGEGTVEREGPVELASTPVMVGTAEALAAAAAGPCPAAERDVRPARYQTMPMSSATASTTTSVRRIQYVV